MDGGHKTSNCIEPDDAVELIDSVAKSASHFTASLLMTLPAFNKGCAYLNIV
jgi:hypothetical protein